MQHLGTNPEIKVEQQYTYAWLKSLPYFKMQLMSKKR